MRRRLPLLVVGGLAFAFLPTFHAQAATATVSAVAEAYAPPVVTIQQGDSLDFVNRDLLFHNVASDQTGLFTSTVIGGNLLNGNTTPVNGVSTLLPGAYAYHCDIHPETMHGVLVVQGSAPTLPVPAAPGVSVLPSAGVVPVPTSLTVSPDGKSLYAASYVQGAVDVMSILDGGGGALGPASTYATGFTNPLGIAFDDAAGTLFVSDSHQLPGGRTVGRVWAIPPGGGAAQTTVIDGLPNGRHNTNGMAVKGNLLYITNGSSTDDGVSGGDPEVPPWTGALISVPVSARGLQFDPANVPAGVALVAQGMRNVYDVAFRPGTPEAWVPMNGPDSFDPYGEDLLLKVPDVTAPAPNFGFPQCLYGTGGVGDTEPNPLIAGSTCTGWARPEQIMGLHVSADGLAFGPGGGWGNDLYVAEWGFIWSPGDIGHKIVRVPITVDAAGVAHAGTPQTFLVGGAPLDLTFGPDGTMYVADFAAGIEVVKHL